MLSNSRRQTWQANLAGKFGSILLCILRDVKPSAKANMTNTPTDALLHIQQEWFAALVSDACTKLQQGGTVIGIRASLDKQNVEREVAFDVLAIAEGILYGERSNKFLDTDWWTTRFIAEQATHSLIARHHAQRFRLAANVVEICTGSANDTRALYSAVNQVTSIESDDLLFAIASRNLSKYAAGVRCLHADAMHLTSEFYSQFDAMWCDPARRDLQDRKGTKPELYSPPLSWLMGLPIKGTVGIKISPAVNMEEVYSWQTMHEHGWRREWIGFDGECKEQILWKNVAIADNTVTLVDSAFEWQPQNNRATISCIEASECAGMILVEPHNAVIRSGILAEIYSKLSVQLLDSRVAYGISSATVQLPYDAMFQQFRILEIMPFSLKALQKKITELRWNSRTEIKKRAFAEQPEEIRKRLCFCDSDLFGTVVLTRIGSAPYMLLCTRV